MLGSLWKQLSVTLGFRDLSNGPPNSEPGLIELYSSTSPKVHLVFIHDLTEDRERPWTSHDSNDFWPKFLLESSAEFKDARILIYGYKSDKLDTLGDFLNPDTLERHAKKLLSTIPFCLDNVGKHEQDYQPVIFFAHSYGGLIYEQAIVLSSIDVEEGVTDTTPSLRQQRAFFFDTPHFEAGLAEWAILAATQVGLIRGQTAQLWDWRSLELQLTRLSAMQREFRNHYRNNSLKVAACFATCPVPMSGLALSSEWTVLPEFRPIAIHDHFFGMTRLRSPKDPAFKAISTVIMRWMDEFFRQPESDEVPQIPRDNDPYRSSRRMSAPMAQEKARRRFYHLSLLTYRATRGALKLGSIIRMRPRGGRFVIFAMPENVLPGRELIEASDLTRLSYNTLKLTPETDDLGLWSRFTGQRDIDFKAITTEQWQPDEEYLNAARHFDLPAWKEPYEDYIVTCVKVANGATIPTEYRGPENHYDIGIAVVVDQVLRTRAGSSITPGGSQLERPEDVLIAFSVQELRLNETQE